jgi:hypothetical protein
MQIISLNKVIRLFNHLPIGLPLPYVQTVLPPAGLICFTPPKGSKSGKLAFQPLSGAILCTHAGSVSEFRTLFTDIGSYGLAGLLWR